MEAETIENNRLLKAVQKLNLKHDAECYVSSETVCCTLKFTDFVPMNYDAVRIACNGLRDLLIIDDGKTLHYRAQTAPGQFLKGTYARAKAILKATGFSN